MMSWSMNFQGNLNSKLYTSAYMCCVAKATFMRDDRVTYFLSYTHRILRAEAVYLFIRYRTKYKFSFRTSYLLGLIRVKAPHQVRPLNAHSKLNFQSNINNLNIRLLKFIPFDKYGVLDLIYLRRFNN